MKVSKAKLVALVSILALSFAVALACGEDTKEKTTLIQPILRLT